MFSCQYQYTSIVIYVYYFLMALTIILIVYLFNFQVLLSLLLNLLLQISRNVFRLPSFSFPLFHFFFITSFLIFPVHLHFESVKLITEFRRNTHLLDSLLNIHHLRLYSLEQNDTHQTTFADQIALITSGKLDITTFFTIVEHFSNCQHHRSY